MSFLQNTEHYNSFVVLEKCKRHSLYQEQAFLLIKVGKVKEATEMLIQTSGDNIQSVVDLALKFGVDSDLLWDSILQKCAGDTDKVTQLLEYVDVYEQPDKFIDLYPDLAIAELTPVLEKMLNKL